MDVHNVFLHGNLVEELYTKVPPGFRNIAPNFSLQVEKVIVQLKTSSLLLVC